MLGCVIAALEVRPIAIGANGDPSRLAAYGADVLRDLLPMPGARRVAHFAERIGMRHTEFGVRTSHPFANVNTRDDLAQARATARIGDRAHRAED